MHQAIDTLNGLHAHARGMVRAYSAALDRVRDERLREVLLGFRLDHERHLSDATSLVLRLGGQPLGRRDARGPWLEGFAALSALWGDAAAIRALEKCEEAGLRLYGEARALLAESGGPLVQRGLDDHARHLGWLRDAERIMPDRREARP